MSVLDDNTALRDSYLIEHGLTAADFGLNYCYPVIPGTNWDWYKDHKFGVGAVYRRSGLFLIYLNPEGEPYLEDEVPYGVVRFLGTPVGVPEGEGAPKVLSQWGRRSEIHFEPLRNGLAWESLPHGSKVVHCESLIKAKAVHKATGLACIGYNGVNGFSSAKQGVELIHTYSGFAFDKFDNVILFDSDVLTNPRVTAAREQLSHKLRHILNCPLVSWASLPQREMTDAPPINWGPDDFIQYRGAPALVKVIEGAEPFQDEEFSSLVEQMNERIRWVRGQNAVFDRARRSLTNWREATLAFRNVNRTVIAQKSKRIVYGTDVWLQSVHRQECDNVGYRYLGPEYFEVDGQTLANEFVPAGAEAGPESLNVDGAIYQTLIRLFSDTDLEQLRSYLKFLKYSADKPTSYCVLWSTVRGVGKGWFVDMARALLGNRHVSASTADMLAEKFNLHTINCRLLIAHEFQASSGAAKKLALQYLKNYVGDETIPVRAMNRNPYQAQVRAGLIITVNDKSDMPSDGLGDRRQWYIEGALGARERGLALWKDDEWVPAWEALKNPIEMGRFARWIADGVDTDFKTWRPALTEERAADLMEGMNSIVRAAHEVLLDCRESDVVVLDAKTIKLLMNKKLDQEVTVLNLGPYLKDAGWWTDKKYSRLTESKVSAWFSLDPTGNPHYLPSEIPKLMRANAAKMIPQKY